MKAHSSQRRPTKANTGPQHPTTANEGQRRPFDITSRVRDDENGPKRRQTRHLGPRYVFFLDLFYFLILLFKYFPGPEMRSQRVLGPLFHLFYYFYFYFNFTGPETRHVSWALVLIIFFSLPRA